MKEPKFTWGQLVFWVCLVSKEIKSFKICSINQENDAELGIVFSYRSNDEKEDYRYEEILGDTVDAAIEAATYQATRLLEERIAAEKLVFAQDIENIGEAQLKYRKDLMSSLEEDAAKSE